MRPASCRRGFARRLFGTLALLAAFGHGSAAASCDDAAAVAAARADVDARCDCAGAPTHGVWVRCAAGVARARVLDGTLPAACRGVVKKCASRSTCGRPGWVACCRTSGARTTCRPKRSAALCTAPSGGSACASAVASCCDACIGTACAVTTTTTSTSTTTTTVRPGSCFNVVQPPGSCAGDDGCPEGYTCAAGECRAGACTTRADCPAAGECVIDGGEAAGTCVCRGCDALSCPLACRRRLLSTGCLCTSEHDCPDEDDVCFLSICS